MEERKIKGKEKCFIIKKYVDLKKLLIAIMERLLSA